MFEFILLQNYQLNLFHEVLTGQLSTFAQKIIIFSAHCIRKLILKNTKKYSHRKNFSEIKVIFRWKDRVEFFYKVPNRGHFIYEITKQDR